MQIAVLLLTHGFFLCQSALCIYETRLVNPEPAEGYGGDRGALADF